MPDHVRPNTPPWFRQHGGQEHRYKLLYGGEEIRSGEKAMKARIVSSKMTNIQLAAVDQMGITTGIS